jgi:hypothetical protein
MYKYVHLDVWRGTKYYTTLNTAIISIGFGVIATLLTLNPIIKTSFFATIPIFVMGMFASYFAYFSIRRHRENFLQAIWFKTVIEEALKDKLEIILKDAKIPTNSDKWRLTPVYSLPDKDHQELLSCKQLWIDSRIYRKGGIASYFMRFQQVFFIVNLSGLVLVGLLYFFA